jgi:hypothetical protein
VAHTQNRFPAEVRDWVSVVIYHAPHQNQLLANNLLLSLPVNSSDHLLRSTSEFYNALVAATGYQICLQSATPRDHDAVT